MPRTRATKQATSVIHQTIEMPQQQNSAPEEPKPDKPDFWTYMQSLSQDAWKDHIVYLTRERPKTSINGLGGYLTKLMQPFDIEDIKSAFGGYEFSYIMKRKNDLIYSGRFTIETPPKFDPAREQASVAAAPSAATADVNGVVNQVMTLLREELNHARESGQGSSGANEATVDMLSSASKKAMEILEKQVPQAGSPATMMKEMVEAMKSMGVIGGQQHGSTLGALVQELSPLIALVSPLIEKFITPQDPMAQITTFMTIFDKLDALRGSGGGGGGKTDTNTLILEGIKTLPSVIEQMVANKAQQRPPMPSRQFVPSPAPPAAGFPRTIAPQSASTAAPGSSGAAPMASTPLRTVRLDDAPMPADPNPNVGAPTSAPMPGEPTAAEYDAWVSTRVVEMLYLGFDGDDIVSWLEIVKPEIVRDLDKYSVDQIESLFRFDPILSHALDHPNCKHVLAEAKLAAAEIVADEAAGEDENRVPVKVN